MPNEGVDRATEAEGAVNPYASPKSAFTEGEGREEAELDPSDWRLHGQVRRARRLLLLLGLVALYASMSEPWTFVPTSVLLGVAYLVTRQRAPLLGLLVGFAAFLPHGTGSFGVLANRWKGGDFLGGLSEEPLFTLFGGDKAAIHYVVTLALGFVLWRGVRAAATLFGRESRAWLLLRPGLTAASGLSLLCAMESSTSGWWGSYAAALEIAWAAACVPFVWRARDEWLPLFNGRKVKAEHLLLVGVCLVVLGLFTSEYFWFARKVRVTLLSWPVRFSMKGLPPGAVVVLLVAFRPFVEELFFRGFVQTRFERVMTARHALMAQAMLFSAAQGADGAVLNDLLVGLTLGWVRHRSRNLYAPLALHVIYAAWVTLAGLGYLTGPFALELYY